jgi:hypothetical protein
MASALGAIRWYVLSFVFTTNVSWGLGDFTEFRWSTYTSSMDCTEKAHNLYKMTNYLQQFLIPYLYQPLFITCKHPSHYSLPNHLCTLFPQGSDSEAGVQEASLKGYIRYSAKHTLKRHTKRLETFFFTNYYVQGINESCLK